MNANRVLVMVVALGLTAAACTGAAGSPARSAAPEPAASGGAGSTADAAARQYCTDKGGMLVDRVATWNTNADPAAQLPLAGRMTFCEFESGTGDSTTRISVDLLTLSSEAPTLAAVAYLSKVGPTVPPTPAQNPGAYNCNTGLGAAGTFGNTAAGGGWVDASQPVFKVMDMCVFADFSAIDEFGIFYYANGTVRGVDLAPLFRYQPNGRLPAMFEAPSR
jgi:putative hemolysin